MVKAKKKTPHCFSLAVSTTGRCLQILAILNKEPWVGNTRCIIFGDFWWHNRGQREQYLRRQPCPVPSITLAHRYQEVHFMPLTTHLSPSACPHKSGKSSVSHLGTRTPFRAMTWKLAHGVSRAAAESLDFHDLTGRCYRRQQKGVKGELECSCVCWSRWAVRTACHGLTGEGVSGYPVSEALDRGPVIENMLLVQTLNI